MTEKNGVADIVGTVAHMKKTGSFKVLIAVLVAGVFLLVLGSFFLPGNDEEKADEADTLTYIDFFEYKKLLEAEIEAVCSSVSGVRNASAILFFGDTGGSQYAQNTQTGGSGVQKNEYVIIGSGSGAHALYLGEKLPVLTGIGVVCDTGGSEAKRNELLSLLSATYGLPMTRIYISESG